MTNEPDELKRMREIERERYGDDRFADVLRITVTPDDQATDASRERARNAQEGEDAPRVVSFGSHDQLRGLLTPRRVELIESMMADAPESITDLAERVDRGYSQVYEDLQTLEEYGVVAFAREGRARRPFVPYERIEYGGTITSDGEERATA